MHANKQLIMYSSFYNVSAITKFIIIRIVAITHQQYSFDHFYQLAVLANSFLYIYNDCFT